MTDKTSEREMLHEIMGALTISQGMVSFLQRDIEGKASLTNEERLLKIQKTLAGIDRAIQAGRKLRQIITKRDERGQ